MPGITPLPDSSLPPPRSDYDDFLTAELILAVHLLLYVSRSIQPHLPGYSVKIVLSGLQRTDRPLCRTAATPAHLLCHHALLRRRAQADSAGRGARNVPRDKSRHQVTASLLTMTDLVVLFQRRQYSTTQLLTVVKQIYTMVLIFANIQPNPHFADVRRCSALVNTGLHYRHCHWLKKLSSLVEKELARTAG